MSLILYLQMIAKQLHIVGKVQGVFYRKTAKEMAEKLHINGWIKNEDDDSVTATIEGEDQQLDQFIQWCKIGPDHAKVQQVSIKEIDNPTPFNGFKIIH